MSAPAIERLLDTKEAAEVLNVTYDWLKRQAAGRHVPHTRLGRHVRFSPDHIRLIIEQGEASPNRVPARGSARTKL